MSEVNINSKCWPILSKHIGKIGYFTSVDEEDVKHVKHSILAFDSSNRRVYGDEITLAEYRIKDTKYLKHCYDSGYTKDVSWP